MGPVRAGEDAVSPMLAPLPRLHTPHSCLTPNSRTGVDHLSPTEGQKRWSQHIFRLTQIPARCARGLKDLEPRKAINSDRPACCDFVILSESLLPVLIRGFQVSASVRRFAQPIVVSMLAHISMRVRWGICQPDRKSGRQHRPRSSHHAPAPFVEHCPIFETDFSVARFAIKFQAEVIVR